MSEVTAAASVASVEPSVDSLEQFFTEISRYPLLTAAEEVRLAKRIERGDRAARERLITSNLRLVVYVAKRFRTTVQLVDLVQEGMLGLIRAADRYDWRRGCRFSTYATWWIRQAVQRGHEKTAAPIRLPAHVQVQLRELSVTELQLVVELQRQPTEREVADAAGLSIAAVRSLRQAAGQATVSLDEEVGETGTRAETVAADTALEDEVAQRMESLLVRRALDELPRLERQVIILRFGIDGGPDRPVRVVGETLGISSHLVRRLERLALRRLFWSPELVTARS